MEHLKRRQDFIAAARALSEAMPGIVVQARNRLDAKPSRIGFTCSKKIGNAVARNRSKRRMREAARFVAGENAQPGFDYVLIGRMTTPALRGGRAGFTPPHRLSVFLLNFVRDVLRNGIIVIE